LELTTPSGDTVMLTDDSLPIHAEYGHWTEAFGNNLFTDNFVTERAFFRGTASTKSLFDLVLRLRKLEMDGIFFST
jgi:hypothetical protein